MKLRKIREDLEATTKTVSDLVRQLAFAGIAVVWIIGAGSEAGRVTDSLEPLFPLLFFFVAALACDFIHYAMKVLMLWGANTYFWWIKRKDEGEDVEYSGWLNLVPYLFFGAKVVFLVVGYWKLFLFIYAHLNA